MTIARTPRAIGWGRRIAAFLGALALATVWGSVAQTQFNLQALAALEVDMPLRVRALTTLQDLVGFGPAYAGIVLAAWLPAFLAAALLVRVWPNARVPVYALAAAVGLVAAIRAVDAVAPMPVLIDATRGTGGLLAMASGSLLAGAAFAIWTRTGRRRHRA
ncbi:conserved membrane hypothetical protein [Luteimonas sp. 9C]|uniref:hypothetical protein n=1 Tax=Luteimonas sp. 9C TaxID=2653148 RepID=UPI0012F2AAF9|nr:hypothetical protein [Luteimonas sp. 9C]VXC02284.1 conserved membrane hypothetical protein [Luteimonas sp. 9C]